MLLSYNVISLNWLKSASILSIFVTFFPGSGARKMTSPILILAYKAPIDCFSNWGNSCLWAQHQTCLNRWKKKSEMWAAIQTSGTTLINHDIDEEIWTEKSITDRACESRGGHFILLFSQLSAVFQQRNRYLKHIRCQHQETCLIAKKPVML